MALAKVIFIPSLKTHVCCQNSYSIFSNLSFNKVDLYDIICELSASLYTTADELVPTGIIGYSKIYPEFFFRNIIK